MPSDLDETHRFQPRFSADGLITVVVTDARDGVLLMVAHMNAEALRLTQETGLAHFWSRSRGAMWKKGESSGELLEVSDILTDCDQDVLQLKARPLGKGAACHTGRRSCFYRRVEKDRLVFVGAPPLFDPADVYKT
ncbi:MAG: phosphoribosyl-AMP cyclohydrolase [Alphaproteobacteria bacterium]|nr:phosphoribosyl-AMP cyclohydrolase [Alphaproteobacteria bacterium]